jgi:hypothetical protein
VLAESWPESGRVGWLGLSQAFPPAAWGMGLAALHPGDARAQALLAAQDLDQRLFTLDQADPEPSAEEVLSWAQGFNLLWATDPPDLTTGRRAWIARERAVLVEAGWQEQELAVLRWTRATGAERVVRVLALTPPR